MFPKQLRNPGVLLLLLLISNTIFGQQKRVTGTVRDPDGVVLPLVTIQEKGSTNSVTSGNNGDFSITVGTNATLVFSYTGFELLELKPGNQNSLEVTLTRSGNLGEVIVTALGVKRDQRSIGYATATVKGDELLQAGATNNPFLAMYGKAAGVGINIGSSGPTGGVNVRIRGAAGLESNTNTRPLFVVDGVPLYDEKTSMEARGFDPFNSFDFGSGINDVNPDDIESIEILKGAKATVLYGSQALNGVVLITTKTGKKTKGFGITVTQQLNIDKPFSFIEFQNEFGSGTSQRLTAGDSIIRNGVRVRRLPLSRFSFGPRFDGSEVMLYDSTMGPYKAYPNNFVDFFETVATSRTNIAVAGGGEFGSIRASYTNNTYKDVLPGFSQRSHTFSFNGNFNVSPLATIEFTSNIYNVNTTNRRPNIQQWVAAGLNRDYDYNWMKDFYRDEAGFKRDLEPYALNQNSPGIWPNAVSQLLWDQNDNRDQDKKFHVISSLKATLNFSKNLSLTSQAAMDYTNTDLITQDKIIRLVPARVGGKYSWTKRNTLVMNFQSLLRYETNFTDNLNFFAYGGAAYQKISDNNIYASTGQSGLIFPDWYSLNNQDLTRWPGPGQAGLVRGGIRGSDVLYSVLGSATIGYKSTYYLEVQARNDWNSTLESPNYSYFYPGASLTWNFTETFKVPKLEYGKFRFAWADVGGGPTTAVGDRYFALNAFSVSQIPYPDGPASVSPPSSLFLEKIKPFRKREFEVGFNTRWFKQSRLEVDFSFYTNNVYDQIIALPISAATAYSTFKVNVGNVKNWGYELFVKATPLISPKYRWNVTFTAAQQQSEVKKIFGDIRTKPITGNDGFRVIAEEGKPLGNIEMYDYRRDPSGNPIVGTSGNYLLTDTRVTVGNVNPKVFGGIYSDFMVKGFNIHFGIDYKFGGKIFSYTNYYLMGTGAIAATLPYRDESHGGLAYYIQNGTNNRIPWQHNQPAPADAAGGIVYHDGMILPGVMADGTGYKQNTTIISSMSYYQSYINDLSTSWPPDRLFKNDYIKLREISVSYTVPGNISHKLGLQKVSVTAGARNLGYIHKTVPNIDPEATLGAQGYIENSFYPSVRSFIFGVNVSF